MATQLHPAPRTASPEARSDAALPERGCDSLAAALAQEWRAAPWYMTSLALHSLIFFFLLLIPAHPPGRGPRTRITIFPIERPIEQPPPPEPPIDAEPVDSDFTTEDPIKEIVTIEITPDIVIDEQPETDNDQPFAETLASQGISLFDENLQDMAPLLGVGATGGKSGPGMVGTRRGSRRTAIAKSSQNPTRVIRHIDAALNWLAAHQEADGHWDCGRYGGGGHDVAVTSLALLAFLANGNSAGFGPFKDNVKRALAWMVAKQDREGRIGPHRYEAGIALMALAEGYAMSSYDSRSGAGDLRRAAQACVDYAVRTQCPAGGFDYAPLSERNDTSVFGWWIMGIKSAMVAGLHVPYETVERALKYVQAATRVDGDYAASVSYSSKTRTVDGVQAGGGSSRLTAVSLTCLQFLGRPRNDEQVSAVAGQVMADGVPAAGISDFYRWYYAALGLFQMGRRSENWLRFSDALFATLIQTQVKLGSFRENKGSWNYEQEHFGGKWGRVGQTALGALMLSSCHRHEDVHGRSYR